MVDDDSKGGQNQIRPQVLSLRIEELLSNNEECSDALREAAIGAFKGAITDIQYVQHTSKLYSIRTWIMLLECWNPPFLCRSKLSQTETDNDDIKQAMERKIEENESVMREYQDRLDSEQRKAEDRLRSVIKY